MVKEYNEKYVDISFEELSGEVKTENNWDSLSFFKPLSCNLGKKCKIYESFTKMGEEEFIFSGVCFDENKIFFYKLKNDDGKLLVCPSNCGIFFINLLKY